MSTDTQQRILDAGNALFVELPLDRVTLADIARRAGCTAPLIVHHFGSKEALYFQICGEKFSALRKTFNQIARAADPVKRLQRIGMAYVEFAMAHPNDYRFMFMTRHHVPDSSEIGIERGNPDQDAYAFLRASVADAIAAGRFRAEFDDPDLVAQVLWSSVHGLVSLLLNKGDDPCLSFRPWKKTARAIVDVTMRGLLKAEG